VPAINKIVAGILKQRHFKTSMRYFEVDKNVYQTDRNVPESIVWGGKATFEVHTDDKGIIKDIYLVA
jgi:hypothetical protein